jgi:PKD repeat protein
VSQTVTLTDTSVDTGSGTITNVWNFGDTHYTTNVTADISVTHAYTNAGSKTVSLTVSGQGGSSTSTQTSYVVVSGVVQLGTATVSGGNIGFSGTGGPVGAQYRIKMTTDISQPLASWTVVKTATFGAGGSYSYSAPTGVGPAYYIMVSP